MAAAKPKKKRELDLNRVLSAIDYKNYDAVFEIADKKLNLKSSEDNKI